MLIGDLRDFAIEGAYPADVGVQFWIKKGTWDNHPVPTKNIVMILTSIETLWPENAEWQAHCTALSAAESLTAMVWIAFAMGMLLARTLLETELTQRGTVVTVWPACPDCGQPLRSKGYRSRQLQTIVGKIH